MIPSHPSLLFLEAHIPALPSVSAALSPKKHVSMQLVDEETDRMHRDLLAGASRTLETNLIRLKGSRLHFIGPPLHERKPAVVKALELEALRWKPLQDRLIETWPQIASAMESFYEEYAEFVRVRRSVALDVAAIRRRYTLTWSWLDMHLPKELRDQLFTPEEQEFIRADMEARAKASVAGKVQGYLEEMVKCVETMVSRVRQGKVANRKTIERMSRAFREVAAIVPHTEASQTYLGQITKLGALLEDLGRERDGYDKGRKAPNALDALLQKVMETERETRPLLQSWVLDFAEDEPASLPAEPADEQPDQGAEALLASLASSHDAQASSLFAAL